MDNFFAIKTFSKIILGLYVPLQQLKDMVLQSFKDLMCWTTITQMKFLLEALYEIQKINLDK